MRVAQEMHATRNEIIGLLGGLVGDVRTLFRQKLQLLRDEFSLEVAKLRQAAIAIGVGIGCTALGGVFALIMLIYALHEFVHLPLWACFGLVGVFLLLIGVALLIHAKHSLQRFNWIPRRTLRSMKEDAQWIKEQVALNKT